MHHKNMAKPARATSINFPPTLCSAPFAFGATYDPVALAVTAPAPLDVVFTTPPVDPVPVDPVLVGDPAALVGACVVSISLPCVVVLPP